MLVFLILPLELIENITGSEISALPDDSSVSIGLEVEFTIGIEVDVSTKPSSHIRHTSSEEGILEFIYLSEKGMLESVSLADKF